MESDWVTGRGRKMAGWMGRDFGERRWSLAGVDSDGKCDGTG